VASLPPPLVRAAAGTLMHTPGQVLSWAARVLPPQSAAVGAAGLRWTLVLAAAIGLILGLDMAAPNKIGAGALVVIPVLVASWTLATRPLTGLVALAAGIEVAAIVAGLLSPMMVGGRLVTVLLVAVVGRAASRSFAETRRARQREVGVLLRSSHLLGRSLDPLAVAEETVRVAAGTLVTEGRRPLESAFMVRAAGDEVTLLAVHGPAADAIRANPRLARRLLPAPAAETLATGRPRVVLTAALSPPMRQILAAARAAAWAVARVQVGGEPFGLLVAASVNPAGFRDEDLRLLDGIARVSGLAIGAALQQTELAEVRQRLQHSVELALEVGRSLEPAQVMDSILVQVTNSLEADQAMLARLDGRELVVEATHRPDAGGRLPIARRRFPLELTDRVPALARALATGDPVIGGRLEVGPGAEELGLALPAGAHCLALPYRVDDRVAGLLVVGRDAGPAFGECELAQLQRMVDVAILALGNAIEHAETERAGRAATSYSGRLEEVIEAAEEIGSSQELKHVVERVLRRAVAVAGAERGSIWMLEDQTIVLEHEYDPPAERTRLRAGQRMELSSIPLAVEAMRTCRPVQGSLPDPTVDPDIARWMARAGVRHMIQCPLMAEDEPVGLLGLGRRRDEAFTRADLNALQPFTTLAALLLRNARLLAEARQAGQAKSAFLNLAAHELRTPLAVIRGYLSLLEDGTYPVPDRTREEAVETLVAKAQELESLVEVLVMSARLDGGSLPRSAVALDVGRAVREAVDRAYPRARLEDASIEVRGPAFGPVASADEGHVARILDNLLNNALNYSPTPAHLVVEVRAGHPVEVAVCDRGNGIPPDEHDRVFERFHRVETEAARSGAGLGLGLTISRELATLNGGALLLERSIPGQGSVFVLRLPD
jgi:signal transduction histidine kinase